MDADEAMAHLARAQLALFRRHLLLAHIVYIAVTAALIGVLFAVAGSRVAFVVLGVYVAWGFLAGITGWARRRRRRA